MATAPDPHRHIEWRLAEQRFTGTVDEVAGQIDRLIVALVALRKGLPVDLCLEEPRGLTFEGDDEVSL